MKTAIICGCLPSQHNIQPSNLYHEHLRQKLSSEKKAELNIQPVWYVKLSDSAEITEDFVRRENIKLVLYHVRPDPYLRMCKIFVRYKNGEGMIKYFFNLKADDSLIHDRDTVTRSTLRKKASFIKIISRNCNYISGLLLGSYTAAVKKEIEIISRLNSFGEEKKVKFVFVGPASRPRSVVENFLLFLLEKKLRNTFFLRVNYVSCYGTRGSNKEFLFSEDLVHLNEAGHKRIAQLIYTKISHDH